MTTIPQLDTSAARTIFNTVSPTPEKMPLRVHCLGLLEMTTRRQRTQIYGFDALEEVACA